MSDFGANPISGPTAPEGVGGWLLFFALTLVLFGPAAYILAFLRSYRHTIDIIGRAPHLYMHYLFYIVEQLTGFALRGYGIFAGIQLWKSRPAALAHAKRFLLLLVLYNLADFATALNMAWILGPPGNVGRYLPQALIRQLIELVYPVVWYWYLLKSERVHNTFFRDEAAPTSSLAAL